MRLPLHNLHARRKLQVFHSRPKTLDEIVDAAIDFKTKGLLRIKALQTRSEILAAARRVAALEPRVVLEIGTAYAGTLFVWSHIASRKVIACDLQHPSSRCEIYRRFPPPGSDCQVILIAGDSKSAAVQAKVRATLGSDPVDVLYIDGDHTLEGVAADYEAYRGLVRPGGMIILHDIVDRGPDDLIQVAPLWKRLRAEYVQAEEIIEDAAGVNGIGILRTPG
jgi:cephalosporin hydroxylase